MLKWDNEYDKLCRKILNEGKEVENRTAINTIKIPTYNFELDIAKEFPILTTKKTFARQAILEIMWIYLVQSNDVRWLKDRKVNIWNEWEINDKGYWIANQKVKKPDGSYNIEEVHKYFGEEWAHTIGTAYGYLTNKFQKTQKALNMIKNSPESRRNIVSLWHDDYLATGVLEPCVWSHEIDITDGVLNMYVHQRSCDTALGLPFNVTQYAALMYMYASVNNLKVGKLAWSIKDAHIYVNQIEGIKKQLDNADAIRVVEKLSIDELKELKKHCELVRNQTTATLLKAVEYVQNPNTPELYVNPDIKDFFKFNTDEECRDVQVLKYKDMGKISFPIAQ